MNLIDAKASDAIKAIIATGVAGYNVGSDASFSCAGLTSKAMQFCAAGAQKMKDACPK